MRTLKIWLALLALSAILFSCPSINVEDPPPSPPTVQEPDTICISDEVEISIGDTSYIIIVDEVINFLQGEDTTDCLATEELNTRIANRLDIVVPESVLASLRAKSKPYSRFNYISEQEQILKKAQKANPTPVPPVEELETDSVICSKEIHQDTFARNCMLSVCIVQDSVCIIKSDSIPANILGSSSKQCFDYDFSNTGLKDQFEAISVKDDGVYIGIHSFRFDDLRSDCFFLFEKSDSICIVPSF